MTNQIQLNQLLPIIDSFTWKHCSTREKAPGWVLSEGPEPVQTWLSALNAADWQMQCSILN